VTARDCLGGAEVEIRARVVVNAAGPYAESLLSLAGLPLPSAGTYSRDACFVVPRPLLPDDRALAILGRTRDPDARLSRGARHLFVAPWRAYTLVGTWHRVQQPGSLDIHVSEGDLARFIDEANHSAPGLGLRLEDVSVSYSGLVPFGQNPDGAEDLRYGHRSQIIDHARVHGVGGLISLIGVRLTTARFEAERTIDLAFQKLATHAPRCQTDITPVDGGAIDDTEQFTATAVRKAGHVVPPAVVRQLVEDYGTGCGDVLAESGARPHDTLGATNTIRAQVYRAVRSEAALQLADVVFRRTNLGSGAYPGRAVLAKCARLMAEELGWTEAEIDRQVNAVEAAFPAWEIARAGDGGPVAAVTPA
jgi:glycerol-3-phosphate dehydrogenase